MPPVSITRKAKRAGVPCPAVCCFSCLSWKHQAAFHHPVLGPVAFCGVKSMDDEVVMTAPDTLCLEWTDSPREGWTGRVS